MKPQLNCFLTISQDYPLVRSGSTAGETAGETVNVLHAQIENRGKLARNLEANILIRDLTRGMERAFWDGPNGRILQFPRLSKLDKALLEIAYMSPEDGVWRIDTPLTKASGKSYGLKPYQKYRVFVLVYYEPSDTKGWAFTLAIDSLGTPHWGKLERVNV